ncbi:MAG: FkbM family methyltransferase [Verrucomicrobia bacterium]|nr:FkbM family methyltransferase [Verrucomicrobiota bacterium]
MKNRFNVTLIFLSMLFSSVHSILFSSHPDRNDNPSTSIHDGIKIISSRSDEMLQYIEEFPYDAYSIKQVPCYGYEGYFYIDLIDDTIKSLLAKGKAWEDHISKFIARYAQPGSKVLDIGAHIGTHTLTMAKCVGEQGEVYAIEPQPKIFRELFLNMKLNHAHNVSCLWGAAGAENGTIEISDFAPFNEGGTSLVETNIYSGDWSYRVVGGSGLFVDLFTIDSLNLDNVSLIKMDVEAMENIVLDGARNTILNNRPVILIEIMGGYMPETAPPQIIEQIEFTKQKLRDLGYAVYRIHEHDYLAIPNR